MRTPLLITAYLAAIVAANLSAAAFGPPALIVNAFLFIGLDLTARDSLHETWRGRALWPRMLALVLAGSAISYALNSSAGPIALASCVAFGAAGLVDALAYAALARYPQLARVNASNVASAAADSLIFPYLAFGAWLPWVVAGQFVAKVAGGALWSLILRNRSRQ